MNPKETTHMAIQNSEVSAMEEGNAGEIAVATLNMDIAEGITVSIKTLGS